MSSIINAGTSGVTITGSTSTVLSLATNGTTRLNIDASGNLAVGTGNLTFSSTAQRITGDMSNATVANRLAFQTSTANSSTSVAAIPNGTATQSAFNAFNASDPTNSSTMQLICATADSRLTAGATGTGTNLPMTFYTGGSERMRLDTSGNLGIGTASPGVKLDVVGDIRSTTGNFYAVNGGAFGWGDLSTYVGGNASTDFINFVTAGSERARIDSSGNIGIGTTSPAAKLDVASTDDCSVLVRSSGAGDYSAALSCGGFPNIAWGSGSSFGFGTVTNNTAQTSFTERMRIDSSGNVGIGTTSPVAKLQSVGTSGSAQFRAGTASNGYIEVNAFDNNPVYCVIGGSNATLGVFGTQSNIPTVFFSNNTERMRITATGNVVAGGSAALATTATDGFLYVPTCAGTPTGTPTTITGMAPIVVNTTNNKLYFYSGGAWRDAGP